MTLRFLFLSALSATCLQATPGAQVERSLKIDEKTSIPYLQYLPKKFDETKNGRSFSSSMAGEKAMDHFPVSKNGARAA